MKELCLFSVVVLLSIGSHVRGYGQGTATERIYVVKIESNDLKNPYIRFTAASVCLTTGEGNKTISGEQLTPYELRLTGTKFFGVYQALTAGVSLSCSLVVLYPNGSQSCSADGSGNSSIFFADASGVRAGWPSNAWALVELQERFGKDVNLER